MYEKLKPKIKNDVIANLQEILIEIRNVEDEEFLRDYLDEVRDYGINHNIVGLKELGNALEVRLDELGKEKVNNKSVLAMLKKQNPNLNGLSIIETKKEKNDSGKDIDYIKYIDEENNVYLIECKSAEFLTEFLNESPDIALYGTAKDIFDYISKYKYSELKFYGLDDKQVKNKQEDISKLNNNDPRITDSKSFLEEKNLINEYLFRKGLNIIPQITITQQGERLYVLEGTVIKFHDDNGKREMEIISSNEYDKDLENNNDIGNFDDNVSIESSEEIGYKSPSEEIITEESKGTLYESNEFIEEKGLLTESQFYLLITRLMEGEELSFEEIRGMNRYAQIIIKEIKEGPIHYDRQNSLDMFIEFLKEKNGENFLSPEEENIVMLYNEIGKTKSLSTPDKSKKDVRELKLLPPDIANQGAIVSVVIIEVTILLGILISVLALAKR